MPKQYTLDEITKFLNAECIGNSSKIITAIAPLSQAKGSEITFLEQEGYLPELANTQAAAVILRKKHQEYCPVDCLVVDNPYLAYAKLSHCFNDLAQHKQGIHPTAIISPSARLGKNIYIGPYAVIEDNVIIEDGVSIGAHTFIGEQCYIGEGSYLAPRVTLYSKVVLGKRNTIHSGAVLGADGFGYALGNKQWHKIAQLGSVRLGDDVDVGANTTIDRGALIDTVIEEGVKLDNQIQIAHNVHIGAHSVVAGCVGIAGSTKIGKFCRIGGGACINGHIEIADNVAITGMTMVTQSIKEAGIYSSGLPARSNLEWRKNIARFQKLDQFVRQLQQLLNKLK